MLGSLFSTFSFLFSCDMFSKSRLNSVFSFNVFSKSRFSLFSRQQTEVVLCQI